jgi:YHS domain-containing protein
VAKVEEVSAFDPICGRHLGGTRSALWADYKKRRYFFCSDACKRAFERRAERLRVRQLARLGSLLSPERVKWGLA